MLRAYKYRLYPTKKQATDIDRQFNLCGWLYNAGLENRITAYKKLGKRVSFIDQANELKAIKDQIPEFKQVHSQVLQDVLRRLDKSFFSFFRRVRKGQIPGFPRFKSKDRYKSITYPQSGFQLKGNRIELGKIGIVKIKKHRNISEGGKVKTCTISKSGNQWYCCLMVEYETIVAKREIIQAVGIDLGITSFAVVSDGVVIDNPRHYKNTENKIKEIQARYSKTESKIYKRKLAAVHRKVTNQRKDFLHKESRKLVNEYDLIAHEDLNVKGLAQLSLSKSIHDAGWGIFIKMLTYKAEEAGTHVVAVNPYRTSQTCSNCEAIVKKTLYERQHNCPECGLSMDRDLNAAHNILKLGNSLLGRVVA